MKRIRYGLWAVSASCLLASFLPGCGSGADVPELAAVTGTVTLKGAPLPDAMVTFVPEKGPVAIGMTDGSGKFSLRTGRLDGAVLGQHKVSVQLDQGGSEVVAPTGDLNDPEQLTKYYEQSMKEREETEEKSLLPEKYGNVATSGLTFQVSGGTNEFSVEL
ncbi:MAG: hypothetical protein R3C59_20200 [Planctomycetaceae bacterium]